MRDTLCSWSDFELLFSNNLEALPRNIQSKVVTHSHNRRRILSIVCRDKGSHFFYTDKIIEYTGDR